MSVCTGGYKNNSLTQGFLGSAARTGSRAVASVMVGLSSLGTRGVETLSKRARPWSILPVSPGIRIVLILHLHRSRFSCLGPEFLKNGVMVTKVISRQSRSPMVALATEVLSVRGAPQGVAGVEVADASP
jgi:hypothetical protein